MANGCIMNKLNNIRTFALSALFLSAASAAMAGGAGSTGMQMLKSDISPRAMGMGGAFVAVADDIYTVNYNPAGLGQLYVPEASAMYLSGFEDAKINSLAFGMPLPLPGLAGVSKPSVALSLLGSDAGSFTHRLINSDGSVTSRSLDAQSDLAVTASYGEKVFAEDVTFEGYTTKVDQYVGLSAKYLRSTMLEKYSATGLAFDAGWLAMAPKLGLTFGASLANFGSGLKYIKETTKLPSILRVGLSYERPTIMDQSVMLTSEADIYTAEAQKSYRAGLEYHFENIFTLRLGYRTGDDNGGMTMGFGLRYDDMALDFATGAGAEVYNTSQLSFTYRFSGVAIKEYRRKTVFRGPDQKRADPVKGKADTPKTRKEPKPAATPKKSADSDFFWLY